MTNTNAGGPVLDGLLKNTVSCPRADSVYVCTWCGSHCGVYVFQMGPQCISGNQS